MHPRWEFVPERGFSRHGGKSPVGGKLEGCLRKNFPGGGNSRAEQGQEGGRWAGAAGGGQRGGRSELWGLSAGEGKVRAEDRGPGDAPVRNRGEGGGC